VRRFCKIAFFILVILVVVPLMAIFLAIHTGFVHHNLETQLNAAIPAGIPLRVTIDEISGSYYRDLELNNITVRTIGSPSDTVLAIRQIRLAYRILELWSGCLAFSRMDFDELRINLPSDSTLNDWKQHADAETNRGRPTDVDVVADTISVLNASLLAPDHEHLRVTNLHLSGAIRYVDGTLSWKVDQAEFSLPGLLLDSVELQDAGFSPGAGWRIDSVSVVTSQPTGRLGDSVDNRTSPAKADGKTDSPPAADSSALVRYHKFPRVENLRLSGIIQDTAGVLAWRIHRAVFDLPEMQLDSVELRGSGCSAESGWSIDSLAVITSRSLITVQGPIGIGKPLHVKTDPLSLEEISPILNSTIAGFARYEGSIIVDSSGAIFGEGSLAGEIDNRRVQDLSLTFRYHGGRIDLPSLRGTALAAVFSGSGSIQLTDAMPVYEYTGTVEGFDLNNVAPNTFTSNLSGWVTMNGRGLTEREMSLNFDLTLDRGRFGDYAFDAAEGRLTVTADAATFADGFQVSYKNTMARCEGFVEFEDSIDLFANIYFDDLEDFDGQTFIDSLDGSGYAYCALVGRTASPDLIGRFEADSLRVFDLRSGQFAGYFNIKHVFDDRSGEAKLAWGSASGWSLPIDSLATQLRFAGTEVLIDSARAYFPGITVSANGWLDWGRESIPIRLYDFAGSFDNHGFYAADTIAWTISETGFSFAPFTIKGELGQINAAGDIGFDTQINGQVTVEDFQFTPYWQRLFPELPLSGRLWMRTQLEGNFDHPKIAGSGRASELTYLGKPIGELIGTFSYQGRQLRVDSAALTHPEWVITGQGVFPIDLAFASIEPRVLPIPQDFAITGRGTALAPVTWFLPDVVESVRGTWDMSIQLTGTPQQPRFSGSARLVNGTVKAVEIQNPIEKLNVELALHHDTIDVIRAVGKIGDKDGNKPNISTTGTIVVQSVDSYLYNLRLTGKEIPVQFEFQDYEVTSDVDLAVAGSSPPQVSGTIKVLKAEDREPFSYDEEVLLPDTSLWDWDIAVIAPGNYWIRNDQIQAELELDLHLIREHGIISILGNAEFVAGRGKVYVFDRVGRIEKGELVFDQPESSDPRLDLELTFRIPSVTVEQGTGTNGQAEYARDVDLTLLVTGYASEPLISSAEGSSYSDQDILLLLAANRPMTVEPTSDAGDIYLNRIRFAATNLFFSQLEREMARTLGIETISVRTGSNAAETQLTVGSYFLRNFYVYGSSRVALDRGQEVGFEYRIRRGLYVDGLRDEKNQYRLNLHLNLEY